MELLGLHIYGVALLKFGVALIVLTNVVLVYKLWPRTRRDSHIKQASCTHCGWAGQVGKDARTFLSCNV